MPLLVKEPITCSHIKKNVITCLLRGYRHEESEFSINDSLVLELLNCCNLVCSKMNDDELPCREDVSLLCLIHFFFPIEHDVSKKLFLFGCTNHHENTSPYNLL